MPSPWTFSIKPIAELLERYLRRGMVVVDPFAGRSAWATHANDLAHGGVDAIEWLDGLNVAADAVLLDPPYSPRQISECYKSIGKPCSTQDTQNARLYAEAKRQLDRLLKPGGIAITCGWNSTGFGKVLGYERLETLLVCHGGAHNDTIVVVEHKPEPTANLFSP